jgi:hypothetical protein
MLTCFAYVLHPQLLSQSSADLPVLQVEVTRAREAIADTEAACAASVLTAEDSAREAAAARDSTTLRVKDAEDRVTLVEREVLEQVSRVEVENATTLAFAREDAEDLARKVTHFEDELAAECRAQEMSEREHRACFEKLTLLQIRGSELFHAIISPPRAKHLSEGMRLAALRHIEIVGELTVFQAAVSSIMESVLGRSPVNTALAVVVGELVAEFQKFEDRRSRLELPSQGSATCYLGHYLAGPGWPTILMRPLDSSMWS